MAPGEPVVEVLRATVRLGGRAVLSEVSLRVEPGWFVGLLGPNGAGKTTLLRVLLGLLAPGAGTVRVLGGPARRGHRGIGYMPQARSGAGGALTGRDMVASAAGGWRWGLPGPGRAWAREVDRVLDLVGATALARRPLVELSGGERQRLLVSQALLGSPKLLLLDEPLISLDPAHQIGLVTLVRGLQAELGLTVLFSAHELNPLLGALDRVLYLGGGEAVLGTVDEVVTGPVLSRLYGTEIEVVRLGGRLFVLSGGLEVEGEAHRHEHAHA